MSKQTCILAVAAMIGVGALAATPASAAKFGHGGGFHGGGFHGGFHPHPGFHPVGHPGFHPGHPFHPIHVAGIHPFHPHPFHPFHPFHPIHVVGHGGPWYVYHHPHYGGGGPSYPTTPGYSPQPTTPGYAPQPVSAPSYPTAAGGPCSCLSKETLQDGSVLFKDSCMKQEAMATPDELKAQAEGAQPTQPQ